MTFSLNQCCAIAVGCFFLGGTTHFLISRLFSAARPISPPAIADPSTSRYLGALSDITISCRQRSDQPELIDVSVRNVGTHIRFIPFPTHERGVAFGPRGDIIVWLGALKVYGDGIIPPNVPNMTEFPPGASANFRVNLLDDFHDIQRSENLPRTSVLQGSVQTTLRCVVSWLPRTEDVGALWENYSKVVRITESVSSPLRFNF
jgi:hypothetical protein